MTLIHLLRHELRCLYLAPSTYIAMVLSLLLMGFFYILMLITASAAEQEEMPATLFFSLFWVPVLLIVPMLTMRSFAEEQRLGTIETLLTTPVQPLQLVLAKFISAYAFYCLVWLFSLAFPVITSLVLSQPQMDVRLFHSGSLLGGLLFVCLSGALFVAIGIFTSSLTRSQLVAGMLSFSILFMLIIGIAALRLVPAEASSALPLSDSFVGYIQVFSHFEDFSRGILDSRPFVYYLSGSAAVLGLATLSLEGKR
jgi:ABC-2 type transport system permease protein